MNEKQEMLVKSGLDWKVTSEPIQTVSGILIPERVALVREDTQKILGIHTENYVPYQNDELLDLLYQIGGKTGLSLHSGGSFKGGDKVWFQLKSNDFKLGDDKIRGYISGFNSFDGKTALAFGNSSTTVSCMNTFWRGYKEVATRLRHSASMKPKIEEILQRIDVLMEEEKTMFNEITMLSQTRMTETAKKLVLDLMFNVDKEERMDDLSTRKSNQIARFNYDLGIEVAQKEDTLWGLFSGVTRYTTHSMKTGDNSEGKMFGKTGNIERRIYQELVEMV